MRTKADPAKLVDIYLDESSQNNHRFLVLGSTVVEFTKASNLADLIMKARRPDLPEKEAKWAKVSRSKLPAYKRIVDVLFDNSEDFHFHSLFVDTTQLDHHRFNQGDKEIGFNKEIYQLAMKVSRVYGDRLFHLYPDYRDTTQRPDDLRLMLNRGCRKRGDTRDWPFRRCQFRDSSKTLALQLTDVVIGAIAYQLNGHSKAAGASPAKVELSEYVLNRAGIADITKGTARVSRFTVWPRRLQKGVP
jgi:hypothetical protein